MDAVCVCVCVLALIALRNLSSIKSKCFYFHFVFFSCTFRDSVFTFSQMKNEREINSHRFEGANILTMTRTCIHVHARN